MVCPELSGDGIVCQSLKDHRLAVRVGGIVEGLDASYDSESAFVSAVLE